jgi:Sigma-70 region 2
MSQIALDARSKGYVEGFAAKAHYRLVGIGCRNLQRDDVVQECWIAWCKARDTFDPNKGVKFGTYLFQVMKFHVHRWMQDTIRFSHMASVDLDSGIREDEIDFHAIIADPSEGADESLEQKQEFQFHLDQLSPAARFVVGLIEAPPDWLIAEFEAAKAKAAWCKSRGFSVHSPTSITISLIFTMFDVEPNERKRIRREIRGLASLWT